MFAVFLPQNVSTCTVEITQYALKGQKLLARAVGELLDLLGVPTVQVETYCCIQVITHYCLGNRVVAFDPEKTEYTQTKKTFAFLFF